MNRYRISSGSPYERAAAYSRAVVDGEWCFVSGTTGYDYETMVMPEGIREQTENCLATIEATLIQAGFCLQDIVRARYYVVDSKDVDEIFAVLGRKLAAVNPAATMTICQLIRPEMKIEIEVTARRRKS